MSIPSQHQVTARQCLRKTGVGLDVEFGGSGQDSLSQSRAKGDISYRVQALSEQTSRVEVDLLYALQGPLAQFSRSGLVQDFVRRMIADFGRNVALRLQNPTQEGQRVL